MVLKKEKKQIKRWLLGFVLKEERKDIEEEGGFWICFEKRQEKK